MAIHRVTTAHSWSNFNGVTLGTHAVGKVSHNTERSFGGKDGGIWRTEIRQTSEEA